MNGRQTIPTVKLKYINWRRNVEAMLTLQNSSDNIREKNNMLISDIDFRRLILLLVNHIFVP